MSSKGFAQSSMHVSLQDLYKVTSEQLIDGDLLTESASLLKVGEDVWAKA